MELSMNASELKTELEKLGWQFAPNHFNTGVDWCAYISLEGALDCASNEKPPSLFLTPWEIVPRGDGDVYRSVEFEVCGAVKDDVWLKFKIYSVKMDDALATIPTAKAILLAAWNAAVKSQA
jgi:hypothetical protein